MSGVGQEEKQPRFKQYDLAWYKGHSRGDGEEGYVVMILKSSGNGLRWLVERGDKSQTMMLDEMLEDL